MPLTGLALWLSNRYGAIATALDWTDSTYDYIVDDTLELLDIDDEGDVDAYSLHKVGILCLWKQAKIDVTMRLNSFSADASSYNWGDLLAKVNQNLEDAVAEASLTDVGDIEVDWGDVRNPYQYTEKRDNAGNF